MNKTKFKKSVDNFYYGGPQARKDAHKELLAWGTSLWNYEYEGVRYAVRGVRILGDAACYYGKVYSPEGRAIGSFEREVTWRDGYGFEVDHSLFSVNKNRVGRCHGHRWVKLSLKRYRKHNIRCVRVMASCSWGGYMWAKTGFNWDGLEEARRVGAHLEGVLNETQTVPKRGAYTPYLGECTLQRELKKLLKDERNRELLRQTIKRLHSRKPPSAKELAQLGKRRRDGNVWLGKAVLAGTDWAGHLRP